MDVGSQPVEDPDVLLAARALGDMRNVRHDGLNPSMGTRTTSFSSDGAFEPGPASYTPTSSTAASSATLDGADGTTIVSDGDRTFISRVSSMPYVESALRAYEQGKASSRVVKYGADIVEGTVKTVTKPVIDRLPVNQLDEFARRQLDRFGGRKSATHPGRSDSPRSPMQVDSADATPPADVDTPARGRKHLWLDDDVKRSSASRDSSSSRAASETAYSTSTGAHTRIQSETHWDAILQARERATQSQAASQSSGQELQVATRSTWQTVLLEAGSIGAAVSEESMRRLKYCLQWLQYANAKIDEQVLLIRSFIDSIHPYDLATGSSTHSDALVPFQSLEVLGRVKRELIKTIRDVVDVVSKYAGGALPEQARSSVRNFILLLPERMSSAARADMADSAAGIGRQPDGLTEGAAMHAATRVLTLATESLELMRGVTGVFKESLDRAESWVDRLQQLGLQRQHQQLNPQNPQHVLPIPEWDNSGSPITSLNTLPPITTLEENGGRGIRDYPRSAGRRDSFGSQASYRSHSVGSTTAPSTRAASDFGDITETEDGNDEGGSGGFRRRGTVRRKSTGRRSDHGAEMDVDG